MAAAGHRGGSSRVQPPRRMVNLAPVGAPAAPGPRTVPHVRYIPAMTRPLEIAPCRKLCDWRDTGDLLEGERLFACKGCGSEWVPSQPWTPADRAGRVPEAVASARRHR